MQPVRKLFELLFRTTGFGGKWRTVGTSLQALWAGEEWGAASSAPAAPGEDPPFVPGWYLARYSHELKAG